MSSVTGASHSSVLPVVYPEHQEDFEDYAIDFIANDPFLSRFPQLYDAYNISGVFNITDGEPVHDTGKVSTSSRRFVTPLLNTGSSIALNGVLLANVRAISFVATAMDAIMDCHEAGYENCSSMSDFNDDISESPDSTVLRPIVSVASRNMIVGFSSVTFNWERELENISPGVSSVEVVLSSSKGRTHTFSVDSGKAKYRGEGDLHDRQYSYLRARKTLALSTNAESVEYVIHTYPTHRFASDHLSNTPIYTSAGSVALIVFTSIIFFSYDYLVKAEDRAKAHLLKIKRDFVRFISHEIRTPLNTVSVGLSIMEDTILKNREIPYVDYVELNRDMQSGVEVAVSVLNDLLNFDKLEAGEFHMSSSPIHIWNLVEGVSRSFRNTALQKGVTMSFKFVNEVNSTPFHKKLVVFGDSMKLSQVIRNLISNALKFTEMGGVIDVAVTWSGLPEDSKAMLEMSNSDHDILDVPAGKITVTVRDTGYGLSPENLRLLFRDGMQFKPNELQAGQGSGLGLFLSFKIVQMHGGRMWATSEGEMKGSCFFVELPTYTTRRSLSESFNKHRTPCGIRNGDMKFNTASLEGHCTKFVLVVDDTNSNRKMVCRILRNKGYECVEAKDGKEAMDIITDGDHTFDCILMDFEMPVMNGPDATRELRELGYTLPIIGLTGNVMIDDVHYFLNCGADQVLAKPFQIEQFIHIMDQLEPHTHV
eukprot:CAMPEP_0185031154 /NCGR_PEP_ID=MMETSP1103-20130426/18466_1 /TAXON_ID=36769 /ORGANISM="Paraphysomonas bandaiensis, Strain Caron Lab Isolate" /LENGTH=705 /DNA_ID=CAMNT_0027566579 /DNA_START=499 /DNA_END=2616 /DNA_ORIENTATION=-